MSNDAYTFLQLYIYMCVCEISHCTTDRDDIVYETVHCWKQHTFVNWTALEKIQMSTNPTER